MAIKKPMRISMQFFAENNTNAAGQGGSPSQSAGQQNQTESFDDGVHLFLCFYLDK